ncbi:hypothetical protein [Marinobacter sp. P4B1]|uniref:hypothetical protein n=1 Tax=Marinobacter sp. P4B1 TaxID=1119533 RepID=UPI00071DC323|nr:hypothetical protein [Marinobacter sp. P4B1]KRW83768.1 hypothetical protein AQ621_17105 [Marinobacter sp. P4B1]
MSDYFLKKRQNVVPEQRSLDIRTDKGRNLRFQALDGLVIGNLRDRLIHMKETLGCALNILGGGPGSGLLLFCCLPVIEDADAKLTYLDSNEAGAECMREWLKGYSFRVSVCSKVEAIPHDTTHLVLRFDIAPGGPLSCQYDLPIDKLNALKEVTLIPPINQDDGGIDVPEWVDECLWLKGVRSFDDPIQWDVAGTGKGPAVIDQARLRSFETN